MSVSLPPDQLADIEQLVLSLLHHAAIFIHTSCGKMDQLGLLLLRFVVILIPVLIFALSF